MGDIYKSLHLYPEARKRYTQALQFKVAGAEARLKALQEAEQAWPTEIEYAVFYWMLRQFTNCLYNPDQK